MKKITILFSLLILVCVTAFSQSYSINIVNAEKMTVSKDMVTLEDNVVLSFTTDEDSSMMRRELSAQKVVIDINGKTLEAIGNVKLEEEDESSFNGEMLVLNWDNLDVVVFEGKSSSERNRKSGGSLTFYSSGRTISYSGTENTVFFTDSIIATAEENPYWSIKADKIALLESDFFFENAVIRLGRVPIFVLPVFFYPGTTFSFNPSVGFKSAKGMFLNTTTELYGRDPNIGKSGKSSNSGITSSVMTFFETDSGNNIIRDGVIYRELGENEELKPIEEWARKTGSYFAFTADAYQYNGLALGFETKNNFDDKGLSLESKAVFAVSGKDIRYALDYSLDFNRKDFKLSLSLPVLSDPYVKRDYFNRNTVFGLDSLFGTSISFPSSYGTENKNDIKLSANFKKTVNGHTFSLNSLDALLSSSYNSKTGKYEISSASLPYIKGSISGTIFEKNGESKKQTVPYEFESELAEDFSQAMDKLPSAVDGFKYSDVGDLTPYSVPALKTESTVTVPGYSFKMSYSVDGNFGNDYKQNFTGNKVYGGLDGKISFYAQTPEKIYTVNEALTSSVNYQNENASFKLISDLTASFPKLSLTYHLKQNVINTESHDSKKDVSIHTLDFSGKYKELSYGIKCQLPPLEAYLSPSVGFSKSGFSVSLQSTLYPEKLSTKSQISLSAAYKKDKVSVDVKNSYKFGSDSWKGYSLSENFSFNFIDDLTLAQSLSLKDKFEMEKMALSLKYLNNSISISFKDKEFKPDLLKLVLNYDMKPLYFADNRIGLDSAIDFSFDYDFKNKYASSLVLDFKLDFAVYKLLDVSFAVQSANTVFYRYYDDSDRFNPKLFVEDLFRSFDFFGDGRKKTGFNLRSIKLSLVHYMDDWDFHFDLSSSVSKQNKKRVWQPEATIFVQWNAIPELKVENTWNY